MTIAAVATKVYDDKVFGTFKTETVEAFFKRGGAVTKVVKLGRGRRRKLAKVLGVEVGRVGGKFTKSLNVAVWNIRRKAAEKFNCKVSEISWAGCLELVK